MPGRIQLSSLMARALVLALTLQSSALLAGSFETTRDVSRWMSHYYQQPRSEDAIPALRVLIADEALLAREQRLDPLVHFFAVVLHSDSSLVPKTQALAADASSGGKAFITRIVNESANPSTPVPRDPNDLDIIWSEFLATGRKDLVQEVVDVLSYKEADIDLNSLVWRVEKIESKAQALRAMRASAAWSLSKNAKVHPAVHQVVERNISQTKDAQLKTDLQDILAGKVNIR